MQDTVIFIDTDYLKLTRQFCSESRVNPHFWQAESSQVKSFLQSDSSQVKSYEKGDSSHPNTGKYYMYSTTNINLLRADTSLRNQEPS